jgi:hypothetical protein
MVALGCAPVGGQSKCEFWESRRWAPRREAAVLQRCADALRGFDTISGSKLVRKPHGVPRSDFGVHVSQIGYFNCVEVVRRLRLK